MISGEVNTVEENKETETREEYEPRPAWQIWAARLGVVMMILLVIYQVLSIVTGGLL